jgi:20S proteasome alpha/beta subunit
VSFRVEPRALRTYAGQLADAQQVADAAKRYVHQYGDFSLHERVLIEALRASEGICSGS